jgi:enoyl-CoA hydratase/carnithine racemase/predicted GIY-YIG superfamily endonuclease
MASHRRVLYIGVTSDLDKRIWQHQHDVHPWCFTARYRVHKLVYFETYSNIVAAIAREKKLKHFTRAEKVALIQSLNPKWRDLSAGCGREARIPPPGTARRNMAGIGFMVERRDHCDILRLTSQDGTNRLTRACVTSLANAVRELARDPRPLILTGNQKFFSAGADLNEIVALGGPDAFTFSKAGQMMTDAVDAFPALVIAAVNGYCMGGGLDLALACDRRIASPHAIFGHRGAALGLVTGWGGTQRLARLVGRARAAEMFVAAEKVDAAHALRYGLVDAIADDPVAAALRIS